MTKEQISRLLYGWGLQDCDISAIDGGSGQDSERAFYVGTEYVIKFTGSINELKKHIELSQALCNAGLYAPVHIKKTDGSDWTEFNGRYCFVMKRLHGVPLTSEDFFSGDFTAKAQLLGKIIAQLHKALSKLNVVLPEADIASSACEYGLKKAKDILHLTEKLCRCFTDTLQRLYPQLQKQIIHRDTHPRNIIFNEGRYGFIDFDLSEINVRIFDPCYAATALLSEHFDLNDTEMTKKWITVYKNILYGYDSELPLSAAEKEAVPYVMLANQFISVAWFSEQDGYNKLFEANKGMTKWLIDCFDKLAL